MWAKFVSCFHLCVTFSRDRKMALIQMSTVEEAIQALIDLHNYNMGGNQHLRVSFSKSTIWERGVLAVFTVSELVGSISDCVWTLGSGCGGWADIDLNQFSCFCHSLRDWNLWLASLFKENGADAASSKLNCTSVFWHEWLFPCIIVWFRSVFNSWFR